MYKRKPLIIAAAVATIGAIGAVQPWSAFGGTPSDLPHATTGSHVGANVTGATVGTLTPDLQFSSLGAKTVDAYADGSTDTGSTINGISFNFGDGTPVVNVTPQVGHAPHTYAKPGTYTITATVSDAAGNKAPVSNSFTTQGTNYTPYGPTRLLDTRIGLGATKGAVAPGGTVVLKVAGTGSIPANAQAAVLNLTVTAPTAVGTVTAYPDGIAKPGTQNVSFVAGQTVATLAIAGIGPDGSVDLTNNSAGTTQFVADVTGYFTPTSASGYTSLTPARLLDTRKGIGAPAGMVGLGQQVTLGIAGADNGLLPASGIKAVVLNVTVTGAVGSGYITAYPDGTTRPTASNLNFAIGDTRANLVIVPVGADGKVDLYNYSSGVQIIADVAGYFNATGLSAYGTIPPTRVGDTRTAGNSAIAGGQAIELPFGSTNSPWTLGMTGYVLTTTVTDTVASGYLTVYPHGVARPVVSTLNVTGGGQTVGNLTLATAGTDSTAQQRAVDFYNGSAGTTDLIVDMAGYFGTY